MSTAAIDIKATTNLKPKGMVAIMKIVTWNRAAVVAILAAYLMNFSGARFQMHPPSRVDRISVSVAATMLYIAFWVVFLMRNKGDRDRMNFACIVAAASFVSAVALLVVFSRIRGGMLGIWNGNFMYLLTFFTTPLFGLSYILRRVLHLGILNYMQIVAAFAGIWFVLSLVLRGRSKRT